MGEQIVKPHDRLFKLMLEQPESANALLRERLGPELAVLIRGKPVDSLDGTFIGGGLETTRTDRLLRVRLRPDGEEFFYFIVEHKSAADSRAAGQLLGYAGSLVTRLLHEYPPSRQLPAVWALVVYHGRQAWRGPLSFGGLVDWPAGVPWRLAADSHCELFDVGRTRDEALSADPMLRAGLMAMKYATRPAEQRPALRRVLKAASQASRLRDALVGYIGETFESVDLETVRRVAGEVDSELEAVVPTIASVQRAEGRREGRRETLLVQLEKRFGAVPSTRAAQIEQAAEDDLARWLVRLLDARSLDEVFG